MLLPVLGQGIWRPILFVLLPPCFGSRRGRRQRISSSLALTVIGGLATSTLLTLLVVPAGYSLLEGARSRRKKKRCAG